MLLDTMTALYANEPDARRILNEIGFPPGRALPSFDNPANAWFAAFNALDAGVIRDPYRQLLRSVLHVYPYHPDLRPVAELYRVVAPEQVRPEEEAESDEVHPEVHVEPPPRTRPENIERPPDDAPVPPVAPPDQEESSPTCHVIIRADDEAERERVRGVLAEMGLEPVQTWATATAASFRVNATDPRALEVRLDQGASDVGWTVVRPGQPDYLLQTLIVEGPDGRRFRVRDVPAQESISNLAREIVESQYPRPSSSRMLPITVDHVRADGPQRVDADTTFDESRIRDGDTVRVGYQTNAGAVNPDQHEAALFRALNQIDAFARSHPGFEVRANSAQLPTEYELRFTQRSLGPGQRAGDDPVPIDDHVVLLQLGPDFPQTPPVLWWESSIFHPNVAPNYGDARVRRPQTAGLVCLGILAESWQPSWNLGDLCQMLIDMAAYRSYGLWEEVGTRADGTPIVKSDFYDQTAAAWVHRNQDVIEALGGVVKTLQRPTRLRYPHVIEIVDADPAPAR